MVLISCQLEYLRQFALAGKRKRKGKRKRPGDALRYPHVTSTL